MKFIDGNKFADLINSIPNCPYKEYLLTIFQEEKRGGRF